MPGSLVCARRCYWMNHSRTALTASWTGLDVVEPAAELKTGTVTRAARLAASSQALLPLACFGFRFFATLPSQGSGRASLSRYPFAAELERLAVRLERDLDHTG